MISGTARRARELLVLLVLASCATLAGACTVSFDVDARPPRPRDAHDADAAEPLDALDVADAADAPDAPDAPDASDAPDALDVADAADADAAPEGGCGPCGPGETCCNGACVDRQTNASHCGACGEACPGTVCQAGSCTNACRLFFADCDRNGANGCEVDIRVDSANCGTCGVACPAGRPCVAGRCACPMGMADCDGNPATGCEADILADPMRCGGCGTQCDPNQACNAGRCECAPGFADCDGMRANGCETDTRVSAAHCGACGTSCGANAACVAGACRCEPGFLRCDPMAPGCPVRATDPMNCGACGTTCPMTAPLCTAVGCRGACDMGETRCGELCVDVAADVRHCGACDNACAAPANAAATCMTGACGFRCADGFADCDMARAGCETRVADDAANCGACGNACDAGFVCVAGRCACPAGQRDCGGRCAECCNDGQCADSDPCTTDVCNPMGRCERSSCGAGLRCCGSACRGCCADADCTGVPGRGCGSDGTCSVCLTGRADCDGMAANGCEVDTRTSAANCGACGNACSFPNAAATCADGACRLGACNAGFADCDGMATNGCEVNLATSTAHCGRCDNPCMIPGSVAVCSAGACVRSMCEAGRGDCDGMAGNGCETDLGTSVAHCGGCGMACAFANAGATCAAGACAIGACSTGFGNCDAMAANGCEANLNTSVAHCGGCGMACAPPRATPSCAAGTCAVAACEPGFGDCDATAANGCETDVRTSVAHCGGCGRACPARANATSRCGSGMCGFTCNAGFADCDGDATNGCEVQLATSTSHCGMCGRACTFANAGATCNAGVCALGACNTGFANCDGMAANGCETDTRTSTSNCGACGTVCRVTNGSPACVAGTCAVGACTVGWQNCDGSVGNGCELNCGAMRACAATGAQCAAGWRAMSASPLVARQFPFFVVAPELHELIVWGGMDAGSTYFANGARYNWDTNTWTAMAASPLSARAYGRAVWTGSEMFVWGGRDGADVLGDGALYNPRTNSWRMVTGGGSAPQRRAGYQAFYMPAQGDVLLYGGVDALGSPRSDGHRFDVATLSWSRIANSASNPRSAGAFTGADLLVFGGNATMACTVDPGSNAGNVWDVAADEWTPMNAAGRPSARWFASQIACPPYAYETVWTGTEMFVWGGTNTTSGYLANGALYNPATNAWRATATPPEPLASGGFAPVLVWTGTRVLGWSLSTRPGGGALTATNVVFEYAPSSNTWTILNHTGAPPAVHEGAAYGWTGTELVVWGGRTATGVSNQGGRLAP